ncbi:M56 family metallopeptidase [Flavobacterium sp.]|uniref:M56 family metallopeptidase n=1 Tax=Flavobacterium sp. TaxID=239 RepID=UPI0035B285ED
MENLLLYFVKANGLIILFYLMYVLFLRKETFFTSNRWYLIGGLVLSLILPLITFTNTIWVEPTPIPVYYEEVIPVINNTIEVPVQETPLDWSLILTTAYAVISILIVMKITLELASFFNKIRKHQKHKETGFTLIHTDTTENPFSFFHYIVINPNRFSKEEFQHILTHESIHVKQKHSIDVLLSKLFCAFFWANPIIWLYRKAMLQNLEFIADSETFQQIENKYEYQRTLLKVVTHQHDLSITNQFYQSLIKKRIVMLHTNQSNKRNVWKYATILPLLVGFMLLFQIETVAQVKENPKKAHAVKVEAIGFSWDKKATDEEMKSDAALLKSQGIDFKFSNVKRNKNGEIIAIKIEFNDGKGNKGIKEIKGDEPIQPIYFSAEEGKIGFTAEPDYSDYVVDEKLSKIAGTEVKVKKFEVNQVKLNESVKANEALWIIDGKEIDLSEFKNARVETKEAITFYSKEEGYEKFGEKGKNGVVIINGASIIYDENKNPKVVSKYYVNGKKINENETKIVMNDKADMLVVNKKTENIDVIKKRDNVVTIITEDGDHNIIYHEKYLKIPDSPSVRLDENGPQIIINGKNVDSKSFLDMDHSKIYFLEVTEKETNENNIVVVKKIEVKTK